MYWTNRNKNILLAVAGVLFAVFVLLLSLWYFVAWKMPDKTMLPLETNNIKNLPKIGKPMILRSQTDIAKSYKESLEKIIAEIQASQKDKKTILANAENGFFDIFVPNNMVDLHTKAYLEIKKMNTDAKYDDVTVLRARLVSIFTSLLEDSVKNNP